MCSKPWIVSNHEWGCLFFSAFFLAQALTLSANPTGGQVVSGTATITTVPGTVTINQTTSSAIVNWQDFSIAAGELTKFQVPTSSSATLNRVTGGNVSTIYGTLQSNGQLYLINPNGIVVGASGKIDTAGFLACTLNFSDSQFNQHADLTLSGSSDASINNQGTIQASTGDVYLIATQVNNDGTITAPNGNVGLAAGSQVLLQKAGDQHLFVQVDPTAKPHATGVTNTGAIRSAAAELKAAGGNAYALAINNSGNIAATGIAKINGQVYLTSDGGDIANSGTISAKNANGNGGTIALNAHSNQATTKGTLLNSGTIAATGTTSGATGGTVQLLGDNVGVTDHGVVDVSGDAGGGTALIGGDEHGANASIPNADNTYLSPDAQVIADALRTGDGGKVVLWGNETTRAYGKISVRGGSQGGDGGFVETSARYLDAQSAPDLSAPNGKGGTWLLDPVNLDIVQNSGTTTASGNGSPGNPFFPTNPSPNPPDTLTVGTILTALGSGDVQISATGDSDSSITWEPGANLYYGSLSSSVPHNLEIIVSGVLTMNGVTIANVASGSPTATTLNLTIYNYYNGGTNSQSGVVRIINGSVIDLNGGDFQANTSIDPANIATDFAPYPSTAAFLISDSSITTKGAGNIFITGNGAVAPGFDPLGIEIESSTITDGTPGTPAGGSINIYGNSDVGNTTATPDTLGTTSSVGVLIGNSGTTAANSTITYYSNSNLTGQSQYGDLEISGTAYANNSAAATGTFVTNSTIQVFNGHLSFSGSTKAETVNGVETGLTQSATGVALNATQITESGTDTKGADLLNINGEVHHSVTATDGGNSALTPTSIGIFIGGNSQVTVSSNTTLASIAISMDGSAGQSQTSSGNPNTAIASGVVIMGNSNASLSTLSTDDLGVIGILGIGGNATGPNAVADGVDIFGGAGTTQRVISATSGGTIGISGLGGVVDPGSLPGSVVVHAIGVSIGTSDIISGGVTQTGAPAIVTTAGGGGAIVIAAAAGTNNGSDPADLTGLELNSGTLQTDTSIPGGDQNVIPNGGPTIQPFIFLYATSSSATKSGGTTTFLPGSATDHAIKEDPSSKLITENLIMGNYYDLFTAYAPTQTQQDAPTLASFNNFITNNASFISTHNLAFNPTGIMDLSSTLNQITNLDSVMVGSGGFKLYDSVSLTVDPIGASDNINYGQIDLPASAPVSITVAPNLNLTLTNISPLTGIASAPPVIGSVIATTGTGNNITLVTSGTGQLINQGGATALSTAGGANYIIYATSPAQVTLGGISPAQTLNNTIFPGAASATLNTIAYASGLGPAILSGIAYIDSGLTTSPGVTVDLIFNGSQIGTTTTDSSGAFSFSVSSADLTGGILLTDPTDKGNTYYQTNSPATVGGIDIWGSTLRVMANTVSNAALSQVAGLLAGVGINYTLSGSNLITNAGINMNILSTTPYTLDGNITTGGSLTTSGLSSLTASVGTVTLSGSSMALGGSLTSTGTVNFNPTGTITDSGTVQVGTFILQNGNWTQIVGQNGLTLLPAFSATTDFELLNSSTFERFAGGNGTATPYGIIDVYGLQGLASPSNSLLGVNADLLNNINASGTSTWNSGAGFVPIGTSSNQFTAAFDGNGFVVDSLTINTPLANDLGLFGYVGLGSTIQNVGTTNVFVSGYNVVGGLIGYNFGTITHVSSSGTVDGIVTVGGLVGVNNVTVSNAYSTATVNGGTSLVGGLIGITSGSLTNAYSTGPVTAGANSSEVGGLTGFNGGTISDAFSLSPVTVGANSNAVGGLVGANLNTITNTYSTGLVTAGAGSTLVGGLVGDNTTGTINTSFVNPDTSGAPLNVGSDATNTTPGVLAATTDQLESQSFIQTAAPTWDFINTWTTYGATNTAQLISLPETTPPQSIVLIDPYPPLKPIHDTIFNIQPIPLPGVLPSAKVIGGASGVATDDDKKTDQALETRLAQRYGQARAEQMLAIIQQDRKDGSTVNTATLREKWVANTGLSKLVRVDGSVVFDEGLARGLDSPSLIFDQSKTKATLDALSRAAFGRLPALSH
jgi:filamentous hemagglutinin family protein